MATITILSNSASTHFLLFCRVSKDGFGSAKNFNAILSVRIFLFKIFNYLGIFSICTLDHFPFHKALHLSSLTASILCSH